MASTEGKNNVIEVIFKIVYRPEGNEQLAICGDIPQFGSWQPTKALNMVQLQSTSNQWQATVKLPIKQDINYRYVVCDGYQIEDGIDKTIMIKEWESFHQCRQQTIKRTADSSIMVIDDGVFGVKDHEEKATKKGWLTTESYVNIYLNNSVQESLIFWSKKAFMRPTIKITPWHSQQNIQANMDTSVYIKVLNKERCVPELQTDQGTLCDNKSFYVYSFKTSNVKDLGIKVDICDQEGSNPAKAIAYFVPSHFSESMDRVTTTICCTSGNPVGELTIEYLIVKPSPSSNIKMLPKEHRDYFKSLSMPLLIGHRGMGAHDAKNADYVVEENTMEAFHRAFNEAKVDMIEFDVQISKDKEIVIYHDFNINIHKSDNIKIEVDVKNLTTQQLRAFTEPHGNVGKKRFYTVITNINSIPCEIDITHKFTTVDAMDKLFPTLNQALSDLPKDLGFNIEVKYPVDEMDENVAINYQDINTFIDNLLQVVYDLAGGRDIVFSCFNPDVCIALFMKQPLYPVLYLTCGISDLYDEYKDFRCREVETAAHFAVSEGLKGVCSLFVPINANPNLIKVIKEFDLVICTWGNDNNLLDNLRSQRDRGIDGIICDQVKNCQTVRDE